MSAREALARLRAADWLHLPETQRILKALEGHHTRTRVVGGIVRDTLQGRSTGGRDIDMATELPPDEVVARAKADGIAVYPTGVDHGTVTLRVDKVTAEVTTLREDVETDGRHAVVRFGTDWTRDAARRDFTMNALYTDMDGTLFDPMHGLDDCLAGRVRFIGEADRRIAEDRLRVYRFFRFSASHGEQRLDPDGYAACTRAAGTLDLLSAERVGAEMCRMLDLRRVAATLSAMGEAGLLDRDIFSSATLGHLAEYEAITDTPSRAGRLAILAAGGKAKALQDTWRLSNADTARAEDILAASEYLLAGRPGEAAYRHPETVVEAVAVFAAITSTGAERLSAIRARIAALNVPRFPLKGADLIARGMAPGPELGQTLARLEQEWIDSGFTLRRSELLARLDG